jgi:hypothetical protein
VMVRRPVGFPCFVFQNHIFINTLLYIVTDLAHVLRSGGWPVVKCVCSKLLFIKHLDSRIYKRISQFYGHMPIAASHSTLSSIFRLFLDPLDLLM